MDSCEAMHDDGVLLIAGEFGCGLESVYRVEFEFEAFDLIADGFDAPADCGQCLSWWRA